MKTPVSPIWIPGLVLVMAWLPVGLAQNDNNRTAPLAPKATPVVTPSPAIPAQVVPLIPALTTPKDPSLPMPLSKSDALVIKRQPPKIRLSPWTSEIVKLAESGIEVSIILSFIENSGTFNLGADQIVYLNDLGKTIPQIAVPVSTPSQETLPEVNRTAPTQLAAIQQPMADDLAPINSAVLIPQWQSPVRKNSLYRVREPYPEEITPPIILIGESRTPNTMILVGFPRTTP
jgi:hypothetical protein